jgi:hypothetical protein
MNSQQRKLFNLHNACYFLYLHNEGKGAQYKARLAEAVELCRELFPVSAKALVWDEEPTPFEGGYGYSYGSFLGKTLYQCGMYLDGSHFAQIRTGNDFLYGSTREEVKARCEQHHQARWLEQLA